jgi:hypothetical protein
MSKLADEEKEEEEEEEEDKDEKAVGEEEDAMAARQSRVFDRPGTFSRTQLANRASETRRRASSSATTLPKL